jgi:hypothetical protein
MIRRALLGLMTGSPLGRRIGHAVYDNLGRKSARTQTLSTALFRNLRQIQALEGPLIDIPARGRIRILNAASSTGCEAYTLGAYLAERFADLDWRIDAFDISAEAVAKAKVGIYAASDMPDPVGDEALRIALRHFDRDGDVLTVRDAIRDRIRFSEGDALADDPTRQGPYDLVLGQNFMIHMPDDMAPKAFANLVAATARHGALFIHGIDLDLKTRLVKEHGLTPVDWRIPAIHDEDKVRRDAWPFYYWGLEPMEPDRPDALTRYASIFRKG